MSSSWKEFMRSCSLVDFFHFFHLLQLFLQFVDLRHVPGIDDHHLDLFVGRKQRGPGDNDVLPVAGGVAHGHRVPLLDGQQRHGIFHPDGVDELPDVVPQQLFLGEAGIAYVRPVDQQDVPLAVGHQDPVERALQNFFQILNGLFGHNVHVAARPLRIQVMLNCITSFI
jgi:hypothetical protein